MVRAFVALELPGEIKDRLKGAQEKFRDCSARLTIVEPALIHITLKFLGRSCRKRPPAGECRAQERLVQAVSRNRGDRDGE